MRKDYKFTISQLAEPYQSGASEDSLRRKREKKKEKRRGRKI